MTTAEAFYLVHICGPVVAADMIARVDAGDLYYGDLVKYVQLQFLDCKAIGDIYSKYTPDSLDAYLTSPFFGDRQKPVRKSRPSEGKIKSSSTETDESLKENQVHGDRLLAEDLDVIMNHTSALDQQLPDAVDRLTRH